MVVVFYLAVFAYHAYVKTHSFKLLIEKDDVDKCPRFGRRNIGLRILLQEHAADAAGTHCGVDGSTQSALYIIIKTRCFTRFANWRKLACYAGVAPFEFSSGSSIKGRTKVSHLADKKLKSLLQMADMSAKKNDKEIGEYYIRKVAEGKNKMLVMNAIRCKILSRIFAVINRQTPFVNTQKFAA